MACHREARSVRLGRGELLKLRGAKGSTVICRVGALWITQANDARDITLRPGEAFMLDRRGLALIFAAARSCVVIEEPASRARWDAVEELRPCIGPSL